MAERLPHQNDAVEHNIRHDEDRHTFSVVIEGREAHLVYARAGEQVLDFRHTFVPRELRGRRIAQRLVEHAFAYAREHGYRVIPTCSYVQRMVERTPGFAELTIR